MLFAVILTLFFGFVAPTTQSLKLELEANLRLSTGGDTFFDLLVPLQLTGTESLESIDSTLAIQFSVICQEQEARFTGDWTKERCIGDLGQQMRTWLKNAMPYIFAKSRSPLEAPAFSLRIKSPIHNVYYIEEGVSVDIELKNNGVIDNLPPSAHVCTILYNCVKKDFRIVKQDCSVYGDGSNVKLPLYRADLFRNNDESDGRYKVVVSVNSSADDVAKNEVDFFVKRSLLREEVLSMKAASGTIRPRRQVTVLGIKYGIHGDEAKLSVAHNGRVILDLPLHSLFHIDNESLRSELTQSQQVKMVSDTDTWWFHKQNRARLPDHLALQAATGFVDGCGGVFVTTGGVTATCADATSTRKRWEAVADRVIAAITTLLFSLDRDNAINGSEVVIDRDRKENNRFMFDAVVFVAPHEDVQDKPTSAFNHARAVFQARAWAVQDNCEAFGDVSLLPWRNDPDPSSSLSHIYDATPPPLLTSITSDTTLTMRRLLRRLKRDLEKINDATRQKSDELSASVSFVVARPGYGWDLTLAHRRLISRDQVPGSWFEFILMSEHTGVCLGETSCDSVQACGTNKENELELEQEGMDFIGSCGDVTDFLDLWIEGLMDADVLAIFPATVGRLGDFDFCATASLAPSSLLTAATNITSRLRSKVGDGGSGAMKDGLDGLENSVAVNEVGINKPCLTIDAATLAGVWQITNPDTWWGELKGLRVLVVHPFADTIARQYERNHLKGEALHPGNPNALPLFAELLTFVPAVGTVPDGAASGRAGWRGTVVAMEEGLRAYANKFDVALLSCGGWAPVLTHFIRHELGKSAVYLGGSLQLHFGILGGRYNSTPEVHALINEFWTWPAEHETSTLKNNLQGAYASYAHPG